jgi:hypothetical protein
MVWMDLGLNKMDKITPNFGIEIKDNNEITNIIIVHFSILNSFLPI